MDESRRDSGGKGVAQWKGERKRPERERVMDGMRDNEGESVFARREKENR